jgi:hypothetical protein
MYLLVALLLAVPVATHARAAGEPVRMVWTEGDVAGTTTIYAADGREIVGFVEYHQTVRDGHLSSVRVSRFHDGSSDEDVAEARVAGTLDALSGRSVIRDVDGEILADVRIDVGARRIQATWGRGSDRRSMDETVELSAGTYWGPLIFLVLKNFDANADDGRLVFRTVAATPKPMVLDMELVRDGRTHVERTKIPVEADSFRLNPTIHWMVDPVVRLVAPRATFWLLPGEPAAMARFSGPRNYARQAIVIQ